MNDAANILIVGAGFSGSVLARQLAEAGVPVQVIDMRDHVGGNCHTERDPVTGVMAHVHGPHIFHTDNQEVWRYLQRYGDWVPFVNRIKANTGSGIYSLPINLHTINQYFAKTLSPDEARIFLSSRTENDIREPANFEEQALKFLGRELYEAFFKGYTVKQWGCAPTELPAQILKRLPMRFNYNDNYYDSAYQALPRGGYTQVLENMLDHPRIRVSLNTPWDPAMRKDASHIFYSGALDQFYGYTKGRLGYRTVYWHNEIHDGDFQGNALINFTQLSVPWTRILEHKHLVPWECHEKTLVSREFSKETGPGDIPYYPKRLEADMGILQGYIDMAKRDRGITFIGRLGTYRYLDMHLVISDALRLARDWLDARNNNRPPPLFSRAPL